MGGGGFGVRGSTVHIIKTLAFLSAFQSPYYLMNWKQRKPNCFRLQNWSDFTDLLSMEQLALILQDDVIPDELHGPWKFTTSCLEKAETDSDRYFC